MNKFTLFFLDKRIETLYQSQSLQQVRMMHFNLLSKGYIATFFFRCLSYLINSDYVRFYPNLFMLFVFVIIEIFFTRRNVSLRILSILANHILTLFFYIYDEETDVAISHLKGVNQMGSCFLIAMGGEFPEALFQIITLTTIRIYFVLQKSNAFSLYPIVSLTLVSLIYLFFHYKYNQAMRAQFMLIQKDRQWEGILKQLMNKQCYIMLNFNENSFQFEYFMAKNFSKGPENKDQILSFFKEAQYQKQSLNDYLYYQMKLYKKTRIDNYRQEIFVKYQREQLKLEFSIFFANQPTILLVFHRPKLRLYCIQKYYFKYNLLTIQNNQKTLNNQVVFQYLIQLQYFLGIFLIILKCLKNKYKSKPSYVNFLKKIRLLEIYQNLQSSWESKIEEINIWTLITEQVKYFPNIIIMFNLPSSITLKSNQEILSLVLFKILSNTTTSLVQLKYSFLNEDRILLNFSGKFKGKEILIFFKSNNENLIRFIELRNISNYRVDICLEKFPFVPFSNKEHNHNNLL